MQTNADNALGLRLRILHTTSGGNWTQNLVQGFTVARGSPAKTFVFVIVSNWKFSEWRVILNHPASEQDA